MAEAQGTVWSNEDRYVSRMNVRHEKHLKKQLASLERERTMKTKSLDADKRNFEERIHRLNMDPAERAHLSRETNTKVAGAEKNKELDRLLKSLMHRPYETRAGYSYIEYLSKNMQPLVKRPLQWGINPSLTGLQKKESSNEQSKKLETKKHTFLTQIEGQPMSFSPRASIPAKIKAREKSVVLPPINTVKLTPKASPEKVHSPRKSKEKPKIEKLHQERRKSQPKEPKVEKKVELAPLKSTAEKSEVFVTMATLQVPTPNYPPFVDIPEFPPSNEEENNEKVDEKEEKEVERKDDEEVKVGSNSQSNYTISLLSRFSDRRKSI